MAARPTATATISFGLVSIPVKLYTATAPRRASFHMVHAKCGTRIRMQYHCPYDDEVVERRELVKGYEHAKGQHVLFTEEELKRLEAEKTDRVDIVEFVPEDAFDPVFVENSHYLGPGKGGDRAYRLLADAMQKTGRVGVGLYGARGKQHLVIVRPYREGLLMHQVFYADEVRDFEDVEVPVIESKKQDEELAVKLVEQLSTDTFNPGQFHDEYSDRVAEAVEQKVAGKEIAVVPEERPAAVIDLFEALRRSLAEGGAPGRKPAKVVPAEEAQGARARKAAPKKAAPRKKKKAA